MKRKKKKEEKYSKGWRRGCQREWRGQHRWKEWNEIQWKGRCGKMVFRDRVKAKVTQSRLTLCDPVDYTVHGILQARLMEWVAFSFSRGSSQFRDWPIDLPHCRQILYQLSHQRKPKNTEVGSLSLLQWIFPIQESNRGLLHCRRILYQLSSQGSPMYTYTRSFLDSFPI